MLIFHLKGKLNLPVRERSQHVEAIIKQKFNKKKGSFMSDFSKTKT